MIQVPCVVGRGDAHLGPAVAGVRGLRGFVRHASGEVGDDVGLHGEVLAHEVVVRLGVLDRPGHLAGVAARADEGDRAGERVLFPLGAGVRVGDLGVGVGVGFADGPQLLASASLCFARH